MGLSRRSKVFEGLIIVLTQFLTITGNLLFLKLTSNILSLENFGSLIIITSIATFIGQIIFGGIGSSVLRFYSEADKVNESRQFRNTLFQISIHSASICIILIIIVSIYYSIRGFKLSYFLVLLCLLSGLSNGLTSIYTNYNNARRERGLILSVTVLNQGLKLGSIVWLQTKYSLGTMSVLSCVLIPSILSLLVQIYLIQLDTRCLDEWDNVSKGENWQAKIYKYASSVIIWSGFMALYRLSDKMVIKFFAEIGDVGGYNIIFQLSFISVTMLFNNVLSFLGPIAYQKFSNNLGSTIKGFFSNIRYVMLIALFTIPVSSIFVADQLVLLISNESYLVYAPLIPLGIFSGILFSIGQLESLKLECMLSVKPMISLKMCTSVIGIVLNIVFCCIWGVLGVIFSSVIYSFLYSHYMEKLSQKIFVKNEMH